MQCEYCETVQVGAIIDDSEVNGRIVFCCDACLVDDKLHPLVQPKGMQLVDIAQLDTIKSGYDEHMAMLKAINAFAREHQIGGYRPFHDLMTGFNGITHDLQKRTALLKNFLERVGIDHIHEAPVSGAYCPHCRTEMLLLNVKHIDDGLRLAACIELPPAIDAGEAGLVYGLVCLKCNVAYADGVRSVPIGTAAGE